MPELKRPQPIIQLVAPDTEQMIEKTKAWLKLHGYGIYRLGEWEAPRVFCERVGISPSTLARKMKSRKCPEVEVERGPSGRLLRILSNPAFEQFCDARETATSIPGQAGGKNPRP